MSEPTNLTQEDLLSGQVAVAQAQVAFLGEELARQVAFNQRLRAALAARDDHDGAPTDGGDPT